MCAAAQIRGHDPATWKPSNIGTKREGLLSFEFSARGAEPARFAAIATAAVSADASDLSDRVTLGAQAVAP